MSHDDAVRARFGATAEGVAAHAREQVEQVREELGPFLAPLRGDERALDSGTGAGTLALALAPLVGEVVGVDLVPELLEAARRDAPANATFVEGDATALAVRELLVRPRVLAADAPPRAAGRSSPSRSSRASRVRAAACSSTTRSRRPTRSRRSSSTGSSGGAIRRTTARCPTATSATSSTRTGSSSCAASASRTGASSTTTSGSPAAPARTPSA